MLKDMSRAALSVFIFGIYMILLGLTFLLFPELMISLTSPNPPDIASRILGMIFLFMAYLFIRVALDEEGMKKFFMWTVHIRVTVIIFQIIFVLLALGNPFIIIFGVIDFAFAAWTFWELRKEKN
ncbi:MAG: hypothetical protein E3J83_04555 [Candidatus Atribacteria bacterium]|nr:MAG: hypothetical protein E3J83_04555 [Candidatus Atribacteria bacterium]